MHVLRSSMSEPRWMFSPMVKFADKQSDDARKEYEDSKKELKEKRKSYEDMLRLANDAGLVALFVVGVGAFVSNLRIVLGASKNQMIVMEIVASVAFSFYLAARFLYTGWLLRTCLVIGNWGLSCMLAMAMTIQRPMQIYLIIIIPFVVVVVACGSGLWYEMRRVKKYEEDFVR